MHGMPKASGQISNTERKEETSLRRGKGEPETGRTVASKETHRMYKNHHKGKSQKANSLTSKQRKDNEAHHRERYTEHAQPSRAPVILTVNLTDSGVNSGEATRLMWDVVIRDRSRGLGSKK